MEEPKKDADGEIKKSFKNFQQLDNEDVDDLLPEHMTLNNEEMLGQISQVQDYNNSPMKKLKKVIEEVSGSKEEDTSHVMSNDRFSSLDKKEVNDDSAINHCTDYSQNMIDKTDMHTLIYDTSILSKNASDIGNKSGIVRDKYESDDDNAYDESKSDLFNPMTNTRG